MSYVIKLGATGLAGGTDTTLIPAGATAGKVEFVLPSHGYASEKRVAFLVTPPKGTKSDPGVARSQVRLVFANRIDNTEACCDARLGQVGIDVNLRWSLNQPESLIDDAISALAGVIFSTAFKDALKKGILPQ